MQPVDMKSDRRDKKRKEERAETSDEDKIGASGFEGVRSVTNSGAGRSVSSDSVSALRMHL